jgi:serine/threonine-protein kinase RIO1
MNESIPISPRHEQVTARAEREAAQRLQLQRRTKDRQERATVEQVLDRRTRQCLEKLFRQNALLEMHGCLATGKEANVYYGRARRPCTPTGSAEAAIKIYKTSILVFRDREKYISGERRFRYGYGKPRNPRKMVKLWAEKEYRNLTRLYRAGVACPEPFYLRGHVLVMQFLGGDGACAAPRLHEALSRRHGSGFMSEGSLPEGQTPVLGHEHASSASLYEQTVVGMRRMYHKARLVHGDLSSFNLLLWQDRVYFVDVSQSMEHDHPLALDFLRRDCLQVTTFFRSFEASWVGSETRSGVTLQVPQLFEYVTADRLDLDDRSLLQLYLAAERERRLHRLAAANALEDDRHSNDSTEALIFQSVAIPRRLDEIDEEQFHRVYYDRLIRLAPGPEMGSTSGSDGSWTSATSLSAGVGSVMEAGTPGEVLKAIERCATLVKATRLSEDSVDLPNAHEEIQNALTSTVTNGPGLSAPGTALEFSSTALVHSTVHDLDMPLGTSAAGVASMATDLGSESDPCFEDYRGEEGSDANVESKAPPMEASSLPQQSMSESTLAQDGRALIRHARKAWKKQVKAANRERRQHKIPKRLKRLAVKRPSRLRRYLDSQRVEYSDEEPIIVPKEKTRANE